jgi:hypothetical protein
MSVQDSKARRRARRRRKLALRLERPPRTVKAICAIPAFLLALEVLLAGLALLDNGEETVLTGIDGEAVDTGRYHVDALKAFTPLHGKIVFEIRRTQGAKGTTSYLAVEMGTSRHSILTELVVIPLGIAAFFTAFISLLRLLRLAAEAVRP